MEDFEADVDGFERVELGDTEGEGLRGATGAAPSEQRPTQFQQPFKQLIRRLPGNFADKHSLLQLLLLLDRDARGD